MSNLKVPVSADDHIQGNTNAPITLLEYGDFQCPHCATAHSVVKRLERQFGDRMRYVYRNFPLTEIHPMAEPAAEAAEFAGANGKYWPMHNAIFDNQRSLTAELLVDLAARLQLDSDELAAAVDEQRYLERISRDVEGGERAGVHATPTFFINGRQYQGSWEFEELAQAMEAA
ncbi:MAG TPA: thioredoxin domain-containing protein [Acidobacteriaceae bacterium]|jgi:protein-disulfide isomerase|nr:thioredoxin domain-containing protein [Acidobacteriaceae bacterium]